MMKTGSGPKAGRSKSYCLYGLRIRSDWPLPAPESDRAELADVELFRAPAAVFKEARRLIAAVPVGSEWLRHIRLADGSDFLFWDEFFEILVSPDGRRIAGRAAAPGAPASFFAYLLGQVLSFSLLKLGFEPMHSTVVSIDGRAAALTGFSGRGKTVLATAFLKAGHPLLTDDLLVIKPEADGYVAFPGLPRVKLHARDARRFFGPRIANVQVTDITPKWIIRLGPEHATAGPERLAAVYVLRPPARPGRPAGITIRRLAPRPAFVEVLKSTFNTRVTEPERLKRQFETTLRLVSAVPVMALSYPKAYRSLGAVVEAVRKDLKRRTP
jgi:hypothetical protein